jgi:hypothetical protein
MAQHDEVPAIRYPHRVDVPPQPDQQAPSLPAVSAQRPGDDVPVLPLQSRPPARRPRNWRFILALMVGTLSALCAAGSVTAYFSYSKATEPNRGSPAVVVLQYLNAYFGSRDDAQAALFACGGNPNLAMVKAARDDLTAREKQFGVTIDVTVDGVQETSRTADTAQVAATLALTTRVNGDSRRVVEQWVFDAEDHRGWRVCDGHEVS